MTPVMVRTLGMDRAEINAMASAIADNLERQGVEVVAGGRIRTASGHPVIVWLCGERPDHRPLVAIMGRHSRPINVGSDCFEPNVILDAWAAMQHLMEEARS